MPGRPKRACAVKVQPPRQARRIRRSGKSPRDRRPCGRAAKRSSGAVSQIVLERLLPYVAADVVARLQRGTAFTAPSDSMPSEKRPAWQPWKWSRTALVNRAEQRLLEAEVAEVVARASA